MAWKKELFGELENGAQVYKYTLTNEHGISASFTDLGGIWLEMKTFDRNGKIDDVLLGYDSVDTCLHEGGHLGEIVGRNANRIGGATFTLNGMTYALVINSGTKNNLHSGPDYYRDRLWDAELEETGLGTKITFSLFSPDGDQNYPGNAQIAVSYTLTPDDSVKIDYQMTADEDTIANFTNHAYFNLRGHKSGTIEDQQVWIDADTFTITDAESIPTGELVPVAGTPMDFTTMKEIGRDIDSDYEPLNQARVMITTGHSIMKKAIWHCPQRHTIRRADARWTCTPIFRVSSSTQQTLCILPAEKMVLSMERDPLTALRPSISRTQSTNRSLILLS